MRLLVVAVVILSGCARSAPFRPAERKVSGTQAEVHKRALRTLSADGLSAATNDPEAGLIVSEWEDSEKLGTKYRYRWRIAVDAGAVRVDSQCQWQEVDPLLAGKSWKKCEQQPEERSAAAAQLAESISAE